MVLIYYLGVKALAFRPTGGRVNSPGPHIVYCSFDCNHPAECHFILENITSDFDQFVDALTKLGQGVSNIYIYIYFILSIQ